MSIYVQYANLNSKLKDEIEPDIFINNFPLSFVYRYVAEMHT